MENYMVSQLCQVSEFLIGTSVAFNTSGICRIDAAAEQHRQRMDIRNSIGCGTYANGRIYCSTGELRKYRSKTHLQKNCQNIGLACST
jgi:hypothetical protein